MKYRLDELFDLQMGKTPARKNPEYWNVEENKWISIADLSKCGKYINATKESISNKAVSESGIMQIPKNTVIMSFKLSIGKTAITSEPMYSNEAIISFRDKHVVEIMPEYLYYLILSKDWNAGTNKAVMGKTLNKATLSKVTVNIHNIEQQHKIVETLDKVNNVVMSRQQQLKKLDELVKSRFIEMFKGGKYPIVKAADVCDFITKGTTPPSNEIYLKPFEDSIPYLKVYNLSFDGSMLFFEEPQYISRDTHEGKLARSKVYPNDVLMNIVGPPLGKFSLVNNDFPEWNINQAIAIFRARESILPKFLLHALMQPDVLKPFLDKAQGVRQLNFSLEQCRNLEFPLPPIPEQQEFVEFAEQTDKSKIVIQQALDKAQLLFDSLMQKYFS